ncbi:MAG: site-2 protease family protein [Prevotella sp.]|nr:site-2 protease family protein [Prevotella sp.]
MEEDRNYDNSRVPASSYMNGGNGTEEGFSFNMLNLVLGVAVCMWMTSGSSLFTDDWTFYLYLCVAVVIHELGHVVMGKSFGCHIKEMQVFFLPFISYKPKRVAGGSSWRDIKWSLGTLPLGGVTVFKSRGSYADGDVDGYIEDKPAWQRLLISAAGVLFNLATFLILYYVLPLLSYEWFSLLRPLAVLSLLLAVLNILPVYPLDGGSIVFALYEIVTGKKPSPAFTKVSGWIGFAFIVLFFWVFPEWLDGLLDRVFRLFF